jgi:3-oxoacyl-[acyl-carrier protein] reductase
MSASIDLNGRTALVTGASKGIGRAIAVALGEAGCDVVVGYGRDEDGARKVCEQIAAAGRIGIELSVNVSNPTSIKQLFERAVEAVGPLDIVVANAGIELIDVPFTDYTETQYDQIFDTNTKGTFFTLQHAARSMRDHGRIIVICSNTTVLSLPGFAVYGASKLAPKFFVEVLAKEIGARGITVNSISPGVTRAAGVFTDVRDDDAYLQQMRAATPLQRIGEPRDVANAVLLLASEHGAFITGHHLAVDGGAAL